MIDRVKDKESDRDRIINVYRTKKKKEKTQRKVRENERRDLTDERREFLQLLTCVYVSECVCVCVRERERER